jgi:hypothetical protein
LIFLYGFLSTDRRLQNPIRHGDLLANDATSRRYTPQIHYRKGPDNTGLGATGVTSFADKVLKIYQFDRDWTLPNRMDSNPLAWMVEVNGFMMDMRFAPKSVQEIAYQKGFIPYIPESKYGLYGVFDVEEGVTVRHHAPEWIETPTAAYKSLSLEEISVHTMNGHPATAFQWFGRKTD